MGGGGVCCCCCFDKSNIWSYVTDHIPLSIHPSCGKNLTF